MALAGVAGNIGGGLLSGILDKAIERLQDGKSEPSNADAIRDEITVDLLAALERADATAQELRIGHLVTQVGAHADAGTWTSGWPTWQGSAGSSCTAAPS
jgi:hypothetical protein